MNIKIINSDKIKNIGETETDLIERLLNEYGERIERKLKEEISFEVYTKGYGKTEEKKEFEISIRMLCSGKSSCYKNFFEANVVGRDFVKILHQALDKLENELEHKLHLSDQRKKKF